MKIIHIVSTYPPYKGGMGNVAMEEVRRLSSQHEVLVITPQTKPVPNLNKNYKVTYVKPILKYGNAFLVPQIVKKIKKADIIHLHWPFIGGAEAILIYKLLGKIDAKIVTQYHMDLIDSGLRGILFRIYLFLFAPLMVKASNKILVSSLDYIKHSLIKKSFKKNKAKFKELALGVNLNKFYPQENVSLLKDKIDNKDKVLVLVGGLDRAHYFKGVDIAIKAINLLKNKSFKLIIIGEGELKKKYQKLTKDLNLESQIIFAGRVSDKELPRFYNFSDAVILPSTSSSEAFGLVLLEGMACGKPILVSNLPGPRSLVQDNGYIIKKNNPSDLAQKINKLFSESREKFSQKSIYLVKNKYNWDSIVKKLKDIYANIRS